MGKEILTSAKLDENLFKEFKIEGIKNKLTFKDFIEKCIYLYIKDEEFKKRINNLLSYSLDNQ
jgi:hypothetical protein